MSGAVTSPRTVCVVGSGGREHALATVLARHAEVVVTPGNPGMPTTTGEGHAITITDTPATELEADLFVIGPEVPLVRAWPTSYGPRASRSSAPVGTAPASRAPRPS